MVKRYYVLRISGYGSDKCDICKSREQAVNSIGGAFFTNADYVKSQTFDREGKTHLFHMNCRCSLVVSPDGIPIRDALDKRLFISGALGQVYFRNKTPEERIDMVRKYIHE